MKAATIAQLHENETVVSLAQTTPGRLTIWLTASALLWWLDVSLPMIGAFTLIYLFPQQRRLLLSLGAAGMMLEKIQHAAGWHWLLHSAQLVGLAVAGIAGLYVTFLLARNFSRLPAFFQRAPNLVIHAGAWIALALSTMAPFAALAMLPFLAWRLGYMFAMARKDAFGETRFRDHFFYLVPAYGGYQTPTGKGLDFLQRSEATDAESIARSQLAGIKLLILAVAWFILGDLMDTGLYGTNPDFILAMPSAWGLDLPRLSEYLGSGEHPVWYEGWAAIFLELIRWTLSMAATGHVIIGCIRLSGFNIFRNSYKPLLSQSIVEFWNRFNYYFKELLVDFFFYPTYLRLKKLSPRLRMGVAIFAAAFAGNMYHHFLSRPEAVLSLDWVVFWNTWGPRFFYCFLLALGIWVSMMRQQKLRMQGFQPGALFILRRIAGVWIFYGIILIWNRVPYGAGIESGVGFFLSLFGMG